MASYKVDIRRRSYCKFDGSIPALSMRKYSNLVQVELPRKKTILTAADARNLFCHFLVLSRKLLTQILGPRQQRLEALQRRRQRLFELLRHLYELSILSIRFIQTHAAVFDQGFDSSHQLFLVLLLFHRSFVPRFDVNIYPEFVHHGSGMLDVSTNGGIVTLVEIVEVLISLALMRNGGLARLGSREDDCQKLGCATVRHFELVLQ